MPNYDYDHVSETECLEGARFERFQSISSEPFTTCPTCNKPVKRLISGGSGFILQGDGWASTGYSRPENSQTKIETKSDQKAADPAKTVEPKVYPKANEK